jgi:hypothetical protein
MKNHNLIIAHVTVTKVDDPNHLGKHIAIHVMETRGISSRRHE